MKKMARVLLAAIAALSISGGAVAGPSTDALATCLAESTTGKDRKDMARWIFVGMSSHPDIKEISNVTDKDRVEMDKKLAALLTRLMTENCPNQARAAMQSEGTKGFQSAFGAIGQLAMQELLSNPAVNAAFMSFTSYLDNAKLEAVMKTK